MDRDIDRLCHFRVVKISSRVIIEPSFSLRQKRIESQFHDAAQTHQQFRDMTSIVWFGIDAVSAGQGFRSEYQIEDENDIAIAAEEYCRFVREYVQPFFQANHTLERIESLLNNKPEELCKFQPSTPSSLLFWPSYRQRSL